MPDLTTIIITATITGVFAILANGVLAPFVKAHTDKYIEKNPKLD